MFDFVNREDIAELANVLAWDAVGAQIEPYLVQHAEWQRPCGVALGCRSLNSRGIKIGEQPSFLKMMTILDSKVGSAYFGILVHMLIVIAYNSINCILLHICTYSHISQFRSQYLIFFNPTSWTTKTLPRSLRTTIGFHQPPQASSHRTHHQSLQPLPACWKGWFQCPQLEPMGAWTRWMLWAKHTALACCSCAHRPSPSSPFQSNLEANICRICKICI